MRLRIKWVQWSLMKLSSLCRTTCFQLSVVAFSRQKSEKMHVEAKFLRPGGSNSLDCHSLCTLDINKVLRIHLVRDVTIILFCFINSCYSCIASLINVKSRNVLILLIIVIVIEKVKRGEGINGGL